MREPVDIGDLLAAGRLKKHTPFRREVGDLLAIADRRLRDAGVVTEVEARALADAAGTLRPDVIAWLQADHPELAPE